MSTAIVRVNGDANARPAQLAIADKGSRRSRRETGRRLLRVAEVLWGPPPDPEEPWHVKVARYPWAEMSYEHLEMAKATLREQGLAPATVNGHLAAVKSCAKHAWRQGLMSERQQKLVEDVKGAKGHSEVGRAIEDWEVAALFRVCKEDPKRSRGLRDAAILALGFGGALRRSEIVKLEVADYDAASGHLMVRQGKGSNDREGNLPPGSRRALRDWLEVRGKRKNEEGKDEYLPGPILCPVLKSGKALPGRGITAVALVARLKKRAKEAGIDPKTIRSHDMRGTLITRLWDEGDGRSAQVIAGHKSISTTAKYDRRGKERAKAAQRKVDIPY